jgi:hypothetical protein
MIQIGVNARRTGNVLIVTLCSGEEGAEIGNFFRNPKSLPIFPYAFHLGEIS